MFNIYTKQMGGGLSGVWGVWCHQYGNDPPTLLPLSILVSESCFTFKPVPFVNHRLHEDTEKFHQSKGQMIWVTCAGYKDNIIPLLLQLHCLPVSGPNSKCFWHYSRGTWLLFRLFKGLYFLMVSSLVKTLRRNNFFNSTTFRGIPGENVGECIFSGCSQVVKYPFSRDEVSSLPPVLV